MAETRSGREFAALSASRAPSRLARMASRAIGSTTPEDLCIAAAFLLGGALRVALAVVNHEANDDHLAIVRVIAFEHRIPARSESWEAFQPKLYHSTVAALWHLFHLRDPLALTRSAQLVNALAGVLTLLAIFGVLRSRRVPPTCRVLSFALAALSPSLIGISAQATNDAFVILFAASAIYFGVRFFDRWCLPDFVLLVVSTILAGLSKANGLVVPAAIVVTFAAALLRPRLAVPSGRRASVAAYAAAFLLTVGPAVAFIGPYAEDTRTLGTPFGTNVPLSPRPYLFHETYIPRSGLTSLAHGLLTFRLFDLLAHPTSTRGLTTGYARHRTSLWTRVYAQAQSTRFEGWPPSWAAQSKEVLEFMRALFILGLVPAALFVEGLIHTSLRVSRQWWLGVDTPHPDEPSAVTLLLLFVTAGYLLFVALYSVRLRDYSAMKLIFVLPAMPSLSALIAAGLTDLFVWSSSSPPRARLATAAGIATALLLFGYAVDVTVLIRHLSRS